MKRIATDDQKKNHLSALLAGDVSELLKNKISSLSPCPPSLCGASFHAFLWTFSILHKEKAVLSGQPPAD